MKVSSLLFVRSVPLPVALRSVQAIRQAHPEARLTVLTGTASISGFESDHLADQIIPYQASRFGVLAAGPDCIHRLRMGKFDCVLVPYIGADWWRFRNVGRMALVIGGRATLWLPCRDHKPLADLETCTPVLWRSFWLRMTLFYGVGWTLLRVMNWLQFWKASGVQFDVGEETSVWFSRNHPARAADLKTCRRAPLAEIWRRISPMPEIRRMIARARRALLGALKWPFLGVFYIISMLFLALLAVVLVPLVWLKPPPCSDAQQT
jgi:hypothetical protein